MIESARLFVGVRGPRGHAAGVGREAKRDGNFHPLLTTSAREARRGSLGDRTGGQSIAVMRANLATRSRFLGAGLGARIR